MPFPADTRPAPLQATAPNRLWRRDSIDLANRMKGSFFYLYLIMDVLSRKIVPREVFEQESAEHAAAVFAAAHRREGVPRRAPVLHSDNGAPMKGATMLATLQRLGVVPSFSRPATSNDNPYSEALFKTLKYQPDFPAQPFDGLACARRRVAGFAARDNEHHRHRALKFVTPGQRHRGEDQALLAARRRLYAAAKAQYPERRSCAIRTRETPSTEATNDTQSRFTDATSSLTTTARWIGDQIAQRCGTRGRFTVDFYSVGDYLAAAARVCSAEPTVWLHEQQQRLKCDQLQAVLDALSPYLEPDDAAEAPVRTCHRYLANRADQLDYRSALAQGLPIGSGEIESGHRYLVQQRLTRPAAWWTPDHAEHILALRLNRANGLREQYWQNCADAMQAA